MTITKTNLSKSGKQYIMFTEEEWDDDGERTGVKTGFVQVKPEKADLILEKYRTGAKKRVFGTVRDNQGNYEMVIPGAVTVVEAQAETIEHEA